MSSTKPADTFLETATVGGGCFWCIEAILDEVNGVESVVSGYAGGEKESHVYSEGRNGTSGHAEVVQVKFDPSAISYAGLLRIFLSMHNPALPGQQGVDKGSKYRSVILYHNKAQEQAAKEVIVELEPFFEKKILTEVSPYENFYKAEERHQQYYKKDPSKAYCQSVINPKLAKLRQQFKHILKPVVHHQ